MKERAGDVASSRAGLGDFGAVGIAHGRKRRIGLRNDRGIVKFMTAQPFLFASARLEEGAHDRRAREAVQAAIDETGLGD